ncbi:hypothetical protein TSUD_388740 [Trifolium subterraneum]|uniref:Uncharacterized protein n=1 Tax=Trifolium subterraneum TaxID=3900 RepID=A0A2Z6LX54_TRISU|nr:hypothetical protein TSUD_388740 [Trifolium subterraneum]
MVRYSHFQPLLTHPIGTLLHHHLCHKHFRLFHLHFNKRTENNKNTNFQRNYLEEHEMMRVRDNVGGGGAGFRWDAPKAVGSESSQPCGLIDEQETCMVES